MLKDHCHRVSTHLQSINIIIIIIIIKIIADLPLVKLYDQLPVKLMSLCVTEYFNFSERPANKDIRCVTITSYRIDRISSVSENRLRSLYLELFSIPKFYTARQIREIRGGAVGWGIAPVAGRSRVRFPMVSVEFFVDISLLAAL